MDLREVGCGSMDWIDIPQYRDEWRAICECDNKRSSSIKCGDFLD